MSDKQKADVFEVDAVVVCKLKLNVDGEGNVIAGTLDQIQIGGLTGATTPRAAEWSEANAPIVAGWTAKLIVAGIEDARREYAERGVIVPVKPVKG